SVKELVQADNEDQALRRLQGQGYVVLSLEPAGARRASGSSATRLLQTFGPRVKLEQVVMFSREFAIMIETGVPVTEALEALHKHAENKVMKEALLAVHQDLSQGKTMAQAMG